MKGRVKLNTKDNELHERKKRLYGNEDMLLVEKYLSSTSKIIEALIFLPKKTSQNKAAHKLIADFYQKLDNVLNLDKMPIYYEAISNDIDSIYQYWNQQYYKKIKQGKISSSFQIDVKIKMEEFQCFEEIFSAGKAVSNSGAKIDSIESYLNEVVEFLFPVVESANELRNEIVYTESYEGKVNSSFIFDNLFSLLFFNTENEPAKFGTVKGFREQASKNRKIMKENREKGYSSKTVQHIFNIVNYQLKYVSVKYLGNKDLIRDFMVRFIKRNFRNS